MKPEHVSAVLMVLEKAAGRLELNCELRDIAKELNFARQDIARAVKMIKLVTKDSGQGGPA